MSGKSATLYRMTLPSHTCPSGLKALQLLKSSGFDVVDKPLKTREAVDAFKAEHAVETTPQVWIEEQRIGGYDALKAHLDPKHGVTGTQDAAKQVTYRPVLMLFLIAALLAVAVSWQLASGFGLRTFELFVAISMVLLALQKLQDVEAFSLSFLNYDLLAQRWVPYASIYPYAEGLAGLLMVAGVFMGFAAPLALFIGTIGAFSVYKAVYIDKRDLNCACVGGNSRVPLGFVSLTENLVMVFMGLWGISKVILL